MSTAEIPNFFVTIPHSGEQVPEEVTWLKGLSEPHLMRDVDRYVDRLYAPGIQQHNVFSIQTPWHRYVVDLNRLPGDIDEDSVIGAPHESGAFTTGLHWVNTTQGEPLITTPMSMELHQQLVDKYHRPFHAQVETHYSQCFAKTPGTKMYQLDAHSMPSWGTEAHRDPGQQRPQIVVSDFHGASCEPQYKDLVIAAYEAAGFQVAYNFPYVGGRVTQLYGKPDQNQHCIQVEMRRDLYMNEDTKALEASSKGVSEKVSKALGLIIEGIRSFNEG